MGRLAGGGERDEKGGGGDWTRGGESKKSLMNMY